ncbi:hypothetical protein TNCV_4927261 [Trichonephila clavipes]|nr:hypothetical protein TNCV_4927261 [Trichonephila clavipes]
MPAHKTSPVKQYYVKESGSQIIGHSVENLPARSPDLTPHDCFQWGYLNLQENSIHPHTLQDRKEALWVF